MRLFISINLPKELFSVVEDIQSNLDRNGAKFILPTDFHVTLKFLGEIADKDVLGIKQALKHVDFNKFKAKTSAVGMFPNEEDVRVIWLGLEPEESFKRLAGLIGKAAKAFKSIDSGSEDVHDFKAHLTIARIKQINDKELFDKSIRKIKAEKYEFGEFDVDCFCLMKSTLTPDGPVYEIIEKYDLK